MQRDKAQQVEHLHTSIMNSRKRQVSLKTRLERAGIKGLQINTKFLNAEWNLVDQDKEAAWELYVEMLTRIVTQPLSAEHGDEETALKSIYDMFPITREILRRRGRHCIEFTKIAIPFLNQKVRPFTAKWHKLSIANAFQEREKCAVFRDELASLQEDLQKYSRLLADIAEVEDLTNLEEN